MCSAFAYSVIMCAMAQNICLTSAFYWNSWTKSSCLKWIWISTDILKISSGSLSHTLNIADFFIHSTLFWGLFRCEQTIKDQLRMLGINNSLGVAVELMYSESCLQVEGKGNGIKTVIANMSEIAKALSRPPTCMFTISMLLIIFSFALKLSVTELME